MTLSHYKSKQSSTLPDRPCPGDIAQALLEIGFLECECNSQNDLDLEEF